MSIESVANEPDVGIDDGRSQRLGVSEAFALNRVANCVRVDAQFAGNGAELPVFVAAFTCIDGIARTIINWCG
jgi:hypothetical protein